MYLFNAFTAIKKEIEGYSKSMDNFQNKINDITSDYSRRIQAENQRALNNKAELENQLNKIKACVDIAKAHTSALYQSPSPRQINIQLLSRLSVQINLNSYNDPYAAKLYTEATGQLMALEQSINAIDRNLREKKNRLIQECNSKKTDINQQRKVCFDSYVRLLQSEKFRDLISFFSDIRAAYSESNINLTEHTSDYISTLGLSDTLVIGELGFQISVPSDGKTILEKVSCGFYCANENAFYIPYFYKHSNTTIKYYEFQKSNEAIIHSGLQRTIFNLLRYDTLGVDHVVFIDPIRYNATSLGCLEELTRGYDSCIEKVPTSPAEIESLLDKQIDLLNMLSESPEDSLLKSTAFVFCSYPEGYTSSSISKIKRLCANAEHFGIQIFITHQSDIENRINSDEAIAIRSMAYEPFSSNNIGFYLNFNGNALNLKWYELPKKLPNEVLNQFKRTGAAIDSNNDFGLRVGFSDSIPMKGNRQLVNIPLGVDEKGEIVSLDFENDNFATFLCGAARSGKTTMLHTLITGIMERCHPDDLELWLVDFKLAEFSRYIKPLPLHVRYLLIDESPELTYDLVDRLSEILEKRQAIFKGNNWQKLSDVPADKYMPAILVIIDEFSIMSEIIHSAPENNVQTDYKEKLQKLLAKSAAMGMHFIFSSQGFTDGTKGLTEFSKMQIQQRIAMKSQRDEIKQTLDLHNPSDWDNEQMETLSLTPHYALLRVPKTPKGDHLKRMYVLHISDFAKQEEYIEIIRRSLKPVKKYDPNDYTTYIDKKPLIIDGTTFLSFQSMENEIYSSLAKRQEEDDSRTTLYIGEPRRMTRLWPISLYDGFQENIVVISPAAELDPTISLLASMRNSLEIQGKSIEYWCDKRNEVYRRMKELKLTDRQKLITDINQICEEIKSISNQIDCQERTEKYIFIFGLNSMFVDMDFLSSIQKSKKGGDEEQKPAENTDMDLMTLLDMAAEKNISLDELQKSFEEADRRRQSQNGSAQFYDASDDLKKILRMGSYLGIHFIVVINNIYELSANRIDGNYFRHKIAFRMAKNDAIEIMSSGNAALMEHVDAHCFRYANGLDTCVFRPYFFKNLRWGSWIMDEDGNVTNVEDEDQYYQ